MNLPLTAVILSGGSGTRLWPLSREAYPKQFLALTCEHSLLQETVLRVQALPAISPAIRPSPPLVVCNESHRFLVAEQLRQLGQEGATIVLEPVGRNTAPALTAAALLAVRGEDDPVLAVTPSDHVIKDQETFAATLAEAAHLAHKGLVVTFGIVPTRAETGFGYLRGGRREGRAQVLEAFVEKPDLETARAYLAAGNYWWNSGIFVLRASTWLEAIGRLGPDILAACRQAVGQGGRDADFFRLGRESFGQCRSDSIDYAVMEKLAESSPGRAVVLPLDAGWSDLGSWPALWEVDQPDSNGNITHGDVYLNGVKNSLVHAEDRFVAALGVEDLIIAETADALLVAGKDSAQQVRAVVEYLHHHDRHECLHHLRIHRPWGTIESIGKGDRYQVNRLTVRPGAFVATQLHHHRAEHWIVVKGTAHVTRGEETFPLTENQSTYIPIGVMHRLENRGRIPLEVIEVQSGPYLGEDDIVRFPRESEADRDL